MASSFTCRFFMPLGVLALVLLPPSPMHVPAVDKGSTKATVDDEAKKLQGYWKQVKMVLDGNETKEDIARQFTYRLERRIEKD
jgi:hypothetical protein